MKRALAALLLCVFCLSPLSAPAFEMREELAKELGIIYPSPVTVFHEFWGIPWGVSVEEFTQKAQQLHGISFELQLEDDYGTSYITSSNDPIYLFGHPVVIMAFFLGEVGGEKRFVNVNIRFQDIKTTTSIASLWLIADDVFTTLSSKYGEPTSATFWCECRGYTHNFALPMAERKIDIPRLIETTGEYHSLSVDFDNIRCFFEPHPHASKYESYFNLDMFSPEMKNYSTYLPAEPLPFEAYHDTIDPGPLGTPFPTSTSTSAPRIDIGL